MLTTLFDRYDYWVINIKSRERYTSTPEVATSVTYTISVAHFSINAHVLVSLTII